LIIIHKKEEVSGEVGEERGMSGVGEGVIHVPYFLE